MSDTSLVIDKKHRGHKIRVSMHATGLYAVDVSGPDYSTMEAPVIALTLTGLEERIRRAIDRAIERDDRKAAA